MRRLLIYVGAPVLAVAAALTLVLALAIFLLRRSGPQYR